ncbi:U3 small nucleolar RNA-associated protein [Taphrina deformans PYCC 5710]|uniref:U3 small nucleolar RNA-associated protein 11 n=1 Tax=Taphrina deformans (strain PYCC 5710 / ATCC 11124 / CBS 356.35 / IMI 108563 / JCM 9778 / NBRC 8474) TaxID=1097556 RepID=R4XC01_TAPDE|nr:U3 small nucleolar RNA-associated protein [Taphrina deformans PYCC 5710]|eukprot:CCG83402.1 U3 small nucleolar RNA-associated protein [Taphrina deformans PYCC 5710]
MGSSFARTDAQKKQHKERAQPFNRQRYGLLEKKKDYVLRSADYKQKQARLKTLRGKAAGKNEDEFYFGMLSSTTRNGLASKGRGNQALAQDVTAVLKTQDANYVKTMAAIERRKVSALESARHGVGSSGAPRVVYVEAREDLVVPPVQAASPAPARDQADRLRRRKVAAEKRRVERELEARQERVRKLDVMQRETEVQRQLQGRGARRKVGIDKDGVAKYKWKQERKR